MPKGSPDSEYTRAATTGPNGVSNRFLSRLRGKVVTIRGSNVNVGELVAWDSYAFILRTPEGEDFLLTKEPGMTIRAYNGGTTNDEG